MQLCDRVEQLEWHSHVQGISWGRKLVKEDDEIVAIFGSYRSLG
jgi:hypothetical protein